MTPPPRPHSPRLARGRDPERGSLTVAVLIGTGLFALALALVLDGGGRLDAAMAADQYAAEAARAAAQQIDVPAAMTGRGIRLQPSAARQAALSYLSAAHVPGTATVTITADRRSVTISLSDSYRTRVLDAFGITHFTVHGQGTATLLTGQRTGSPR